MFEKIEATTKRLEINEILTNFFVHLIKRHPLDLVTVVHLCLSRVNHRHGAAAIQFTLSSSLAQLMRA